MNWNPDLIVTGDDFYDDAIDPDSNFLRRYPLPHLDSLAEAFRDSGMHYYQDTDLLLYFHRCLVFFKIDQIEFMSF